MSNYTKGPWEWDFMDIDGDYEAYTYLSSGSKTVLEPGVDSIYVKDADAELIAAAPDLLEALIYCADTLHNLPGYEAQVRAARDAIEKASPDVQGSGNDD